MPCLFTQDLLWWLARPRVLQAQRHYYYWFYSVLKCHKQRCAFFPFPRFFLGAISLVLQQQLSPILHVLYTQPSSHTFWLMALSVNPVNPEGPPCIMLINTRYWMGINQRLSSHFLVWNKGAPSPPCCFRFTWTTLIAWLMGHRVRSLILRKTCCLLMTFPSLPMNTRICRPC